MESSEAFEAVVTIPTAFVENREPLDDLETVADAIERIEPKTS